VTFSATSHLAGGTTGSPVYIDGVPVAGTNQVMSIDTGRLAGLVAVRDTLTPAYQNQIDEIARGLIEAFAEYDQSVVPALPAAAGLFTYLGGPGIPPSGSAVSGLAGLITVNANVDPSRGGDVRLIRDGAISAPGNPAYNYNPGGDASFSDRIQGMISALGSPRNFDASANIDTSATVVGFASSSISWLEALRQNSTSEADYRQAVRDRAISAFSKDSGISLDEDMAKMLDLERTYQASSRLITTIDSMLESLLLAMR
jgi:flagellar hook-associated protein 1 FlgK